MTKENSSGGSAFYIVSILLLVFIFPILSFFMELQLTKDIADGLAVLGKWFIFYTAGLRLFIAGIRQIIKPAFTAKEIFHFQTAESFAIIKELGFANVCAGVIGIASLFLPQWRIVSAVSSGLYYGLAGIGHYVRKPDGANERFALLTDIIVFILFLCYVLLFLNH